MRNSNTILIIPFYQSLLNDFDSLLPDESECINRIRVTLPLAADQQKCYQYVKDCALLGKSMERSLVSPKILEIPEVFTRHEDSNLPEFFYEFFQALFHESGLRRYSLDDKHQPEAGNAANYLLCLRQYLLAFSKLEDIEPDISVEDEINSFVERVTLPGQPVALDPRITSVARRILRIVFTEQFDGDEELCAPLAQWDANPWGRHGPGAVSEGEEGAEKWLFRDNPKIPNSLFEYFPGLPLTKGPAPVSSDTDHDVTELNQARLAVVPKDFRGHRLICIEPKEQQFAQQGVMQTIYDIVHNHPLTRRSIDFLNQEKSYNLSRDLRYATIDLKDASDNLKLEVLRVLLPKSLYRLVSRFRSNSVLLPDGDVIWPRTMFTMGNALCFPIETLVFWSVALATMVVENDESHLLSAFERDFGFDAHEDDGHWVDNAGLRRRFLNRYRLRVFGDDIIVPCHMTSAVVGSLTRIGAVVNQDKTCSDTLVRESCGSWFFNGIDVTVTRFKNHKLSDTRVWVGLLANARELMANGFSNASLTLLRNLAEMHPVPFGMTGLPGQPNLEDGYRWNEELQRLEFRMPTLSDGMGLESLPGYAALYAAFTKQATKTVIHGHRESVQWVWTEVRR